jgi:signal transduction histidine kinase
VWLVDSVDGAVPRPVPPQLAALADGPHRFADATQELHVLVMPTTQGRLYVQYDAEQNEAKVREFGLYLLGLGAVCIVLGTLLSWRVAAWVVGPIERLTARLSAWTPEDVPASDAQTDEESRLLGAFERVQGRFEHAIAHEREFVANVGHEVRTPLTALRTDLEMALESLAVGSPPHQRLQRAVAAIDSISGSLEAARTMSRRRGVEARPVDLATCVDDAWVSVRMRGEIGTPAFANQIAPGTIVYADRHALLTILRNLIRNAVEHAVPARCVVRFTSRGVEVIDDGSGIAAEDLPYVFERYYRARLLDASPLGADAGAPPAREDGERGIGLAIARRLAELNGWSLTVQPASSVDPTFVQGSCFILGISRPDDASSTKV